MIHTPSSGEGIYREHLQQQLWNLQQHPELADVFAQTLNQAAAELDLVQLSKLQSMGLVYLQGNRTIPSCRLYRQYFLGQ